MYLNINKNKVTRLGHFRNDLRSQYEYYFTCLNKCFIIEYNDKKMFIKEYLGGYKSIKPFYTIPIDSPSELKTLDPMYSTKNIPDMSITNTMLLYLATKCLEDILHHNNIEKAKKEISNTLNNLYNETL